MKHPNRLSGMPAIGEKQAKLPKTKECPIRTTIGVKQSTKTKLDLNKAPGQCYDGFLCQLVGLWEGTQKLRGKYE